MQDNTQIKTTKTIYPQIYAYTLPEIDEKKGWIKIGYTERENVDTRIREQTKTAAINLDYQKLWSGAAKFLGSDKWFKDKQLHKYLKTQKNRKQQQNTEWFFYNGFPEESYSDYEDFTRYKYNQAKEQLTYVLRDEQEKAVRTTLEYAKTHKDGEYLWNAKPRFGKTLSTYDLMKRLDAELVLIVTNRPAIANSWYDDFEKFIAWQTNYAFVSTTDSLKNRPVLEREEFVDQLSSFSKDKKERMVAFISLQDLKGAIPFGGTHRKLNWVKQLEWDLLVIDEAHEGVETLKTDIAFNEIKRRFTLHLSGTPFKALASGKFSSDQIYNWSYLDEQEAKKEWEDPEQNNPYEQLPRLNMFSYQMSQMIVDEVNKGALIEGENIDYAFDLNEFFETNDAGRFIHEKEIKKWLDTLTHNTKYPFSTKELRNELKHTFWLLNRVASAKALEKLLRNHPVFENYEIVLAAGDGRTHDDQIINEKSLERVRQAIRDNDKTITLSVGQLTTGVTIPEWTAVLMLSNMKSPSLYMQAAFRAQNPWSFELEGKMHQKENAYVFDFSPERTLTIYDEFANNLSPSTTNGGGTSDDRKENIRMLLNFFPVIAEDSEGQMVELDVNQVLTIPKTIKAQEVVRRGFMSNLLFQNILGIFASAEAREILEKLNPVDQGKTKTRNTSDSIDTKNVQVDEEGETVVDQEIVISTTQAHFGEKVYENIILSVEDNKETNQNSLPSVIASAFEKNTKDHLKDIAKENKLAVKEAEQIVKQSANKIAREVEMIVKQNQIKENEIEDEYNRIIETAPTDQSGIEEAKVKYEKEKNKIEQELKQQLLNTVERKSKELAKESTEHLLKRVEDKKKHTVEDDVRGRLRGFARTIPSFLMAYGQESTTLENFDTFISDSVFKEVTGITLDQFRILRDKYNFFDPIVFNESCQEFLNKRTDLANYFDQNQEEDIFDYIPPQQTNQIYTPKKVVKMMIDKLEEGDAELFKDPNKTFADLYMKSGLYITEIVQRLFIGLKEVIPNEKDRLKHIMEHQVYGFAPTEIIYNIAKNFILGFDKGINDIDDSHIIHLDTMPYARGEKDFEQKLKQLFGGELMKFDVVVGNPPYQENDNGKRDDGTANASASPLYHIFFDLAKQISSHKINLIFPARWLSGAGKGLNKFTERMINETHIKSLNIFQNAAQVFPNNEIKGGVLFLIYSHDYQGKADITIIDSEGKENRYRSYLNSAGSGVFIPNGELVGIYEKVNKVDNLKESNLSHITSTRKPYGLSTDFLKNPSKYKLPKIYDYKKQETDIEVLGLDKYQRVIKYIPKNYPINKGTETIYKWKLFAGKAMGSGKFGEKVANLPIGVPGQIATETFIRIGEFDTEYEAVALKKYYYTKFFRALLGILKNTQDAPARVYEFIPVQDFSIKSEIDWKLSIKKIDMQLYKKYNLTAHEIEFLESNVESMEEQYKKEID